MKMLFLMLALLGGLAGGIQAVQAAGVPTNPMCLSSNNCPATTRAPQQSPVVPATEPGLNTARRVSEDLICATYNTVSGTLGLMAGFILAAFGLFVWIRNDNMKSGLILIIFGALLTTVPGLVMSSLRGIGSFLGSESIGISNKAYITTPACSRRGGDF